MNHTTGAYIAATLVTLAAASQAAPATLTFEGSIDEVREFYDGGTDQEGNVGPDYGVSFAGAFAITNEYYSFTNQPSGITVIVGQDDPDYRLTMNVAGGFTRGVSYWYANNATYDPVLVYDGLNGTGNLLGSLNLGGDGATVGCDRATGYYCNWYTGSIAFTGVARSVLFPAYPDALIYDNITIGSAVPVPVPEPAMWTLCLAGLAGISAWRARRAAVTTVSPSA